MFQSVMNGDEHTQSIYFLFACMAQKKGKMILGSLGCYNIKATPEIKTTSSAEAMLQLFKPI
jgi:hypothetical protein